MNVVPKSQSRPITIVLPWYLHSGFSDLYQGLGFRVLWAESRDELARKLQGETIDLALEWQHGREDYPVRDLLRSLGRCAEGRRCRAAKGREVC